MTLMSGGRRRALTSIVTHCLPERLGATRTCINLAGSRDRLEHDRAERNVRRPQDALFARRT
jgi:hypothetical protein